MLKYDYCLNFVRQLFGRFVFNAYFCSKITTLISIIQIFDMKSRTINVFEWYKSLTKKEKGQFANYMNKRYDLYQPSLMRKMCKAPGSTLTPVEEEVIINVIKSAVWKK